MKNRLIAVVLIFAAVVFAVATATWLPPLVITIVVFGFIAVAISCVATTVDGPGMKIRYREDTETKDDG